MNVSGYARGLTKGLFRTIAKTFFYFILMSTLFLVLSNTQGLQEDPAGTTKQIFEIEKNYFLHPADVFKTIIASGKALLGSGVGTSTMPTLNGLSKIASITAEPTEFEQLILVHTNKERAKGGLELVQWSGGLALVARDHSQDMIKRDFFVHVNPDGQDPSERFETTYGYAPQKALGPTGYIVGVGENLGKITFPTEVGGCGEVRDSKSAAACQVKSWMESPAHRANILDEKYTHLGVGAALSDETYYITQVFW